MLNYEVFKISLLLVACVLTNLACESEKPEKSALEIFHEEHQNTVIEKEIEYSLDTVKMVGYLAYDSLITEKRPAVFIFHEWMGQDDHVRSRAHMMADLGYVAFVVDMFGNGKKFDHPTEGNNYYQTIIDNMELASNRYQAALGTLGKNPFVDINKIALVGYCAGGKLALSLSNAGHDADAVGDFYTEPKPSLPPKKGVKTKYLFCNGAHDLYIPKETVDSFKAQMDSAGLDYKYVEYPDVAHTFTNPEAGEYGNVFNMPLSYDEKADSASWLELKRFLASVFPKK